MFRGPSRLRCMTPSKGTNMLKYMLAASAVALLLAVPAAAGAEPGPGDFAPPAEEHSWTQLVSSGVLGPRDRCQPESPEDVDVDQDGRPASCDPCPNDPTNDVDRD